MKIDTGTITQTTSINIPKGKWLVMCYYDYSANANGIRVLSMGESINPARNQGASQNATASPG